MHSINLDDGSNKISADLSIKLNEAIRYITKSKRTTVITGAGISCNAGIPDFRSENGLYNMIKHKYPKSIVRGQDLFDINLFRDETSLEIFCTFMERLYHHSLSAKPTESHKFIKHLKDKGKLLRCYTQNIDSLEQNVDLNLGINQQDFEVGRSGKFRESWNNLDVVQLHGNLHKLSCTNCFAEYEWSNEFKTMFNQGINPECTNCFNKYQQRLYSGKRMTGHIGVLRPDIVLYGENHRQSEILSQGLTNDLKSKPDLLIIMGTSLKVDGVKKLVKSLSKQIHERGGKVIFINKTSLSKMWHSYIDYEILCDCDQFIRILKAEIPDLFLTQEQLDSKKLKNKAHERVIMPSDAYKLIVKQETGDEVSNNAKCKSVQVKVESGSADVSSSSSSTSPVRVKQEVTNDILTPPDTPTKKRKRPESSTSSQPQQKKRQPSLKREPKVKLEKNGGKGSDEGKLNGARGSSSTTTDASTTAAAYRTPASSFDESIPLKFQAISKPTSSNSSYQLLQPSLQEELNTRQHKRVSKMESVTNLLGNILSLDDETKASSGSGPSGRSNQGQATVASLTPTKKRRSLDLDFSSFWRDSKDGSSGGDDLATAGVGTGNEATKGKSNASASASDTKATSLPGGGADLSGGAITSGVSTGAGAGATATAASAVAASTANVSATNQNYYADKLMEKAISMIIPNEIYDEQTNKMLQDRQLMAKLRPPLSFALMQKNSNNLHQRNSEVYIFFNHVLKYVNWLDPYYTIGVTLLITHMILKPVLFICLPWFLLMVNTLIPHYLVVYPMDASFNGEYLEVNPYPSKQALEPAKLPKPVPLFSKEFFMNLTDTQNFMTLQSHIFDFQTWLFADYLYFKNEQISSFIVLTCLVMVGVNLLWFKSIALFLLNHAWIIKLWWAVTLWGFVILMHPSQRCKILSWVYEEDTRLGIQNRVNRIEDKLTSILIDENLQSDLQLNNNSDTNLTYGKLIEVYELQKLNQETKIWEMVGFTPEFYSINDGVRKYNRAVKQLNHEIVSAVVEDDGEDDVVAPTITESSPSRNTGSTTTSHNGASIGHEHRYLSLPKRESINLVKPPVGYKFILHGKWTIDFNIQSWVESNFIQDLVIIDDDEKWAYDVTIHNITIENSAATAANDEIIDKRDENDGTDSKDNANNNNNTNNTNNGGGSDDDNDDNEEQRLPHQLNELDDGEIYRRRRWIRYVVRETYKDIDRPPVQQSHLASWVT
ncbi:PEX29 [Candida margitis]|uniref:PEX29 n=1 Tax=Candida margitis TaxID=1775924 RepID=UPI002227E63A|nr:PEX29 [Candida margitis]KAI5967933.1 PEX29 [Candida margitis]